MLLTLHPLDPQLLPDLPHHQPSLRHQRNLQPPNRLDGFDSPVSIKNLKLGFFKQLL